MVPCRSGLRSISLEREAGFVHAKLLQENGCEKIHVRMTNEKYYEWKLLARHGARRM